MLRQLPPLSFRLPPSAPPSDPAGPLGATGATGESLEPDFKGLQSTRLE